jgi:hypothetical protein
MSEKFIVYSSFTAVIEKDGRPGLAVIAIASFAVTSGGAVLNAFMFTSGFHLKSTLKKPSNPYS